MKKGGVIFDVSLNQSMIITVQMKLYLNRVCLNSKFVILRLDRGIQNPLKRLDSRLRENDELLR